MTLNEDAFWRSDFLENFFRIVYVGVPVDEAVVFEKINRKISFLFCRIEFFRFFDYALKINSEVGGEAVVFVLD